MGTTQILKTWQEYWLYHLEKLLSVHFLRSIWMTNDRRQADDNLDVVGDNITSSNMNVSGDTTSQICVNEGATVTMRGDGTRRQATEAVDVVDTGITSSNMNISVDATSLLRVTDGGAANPREELQQANNNLVVID